MENLQGGTLALEHRYHIAQHSGSFGLTTIYTGTQDPFDLPVRITVYDGLLEAGADLSIVERIKKSARESSNLDAAGLLSTADFGEIDRGIPFVIEETVEGETLAQIVASKGVLSLDDVTDLVERLAELLLIAHDRKIYHGNLKPQWILLPDADPRRAHLSHFGLGFSMAELLAMSQAVLTTDLVDAFPPEAFDVGTRDEDDEAPPEPSSFPSAAGDQWSLAALAYRLLVGVHPFFDDPVDASEGILRIKTETAPSLTGMGVAEAVADVIDRGLQRQPEQRWPSVGAFARALREATDGPQPRDEASFEESSPELRRDAQSSWSDDDLDEQTPEFSGPRPSGYLLTIALVLLAVTNLGWFFLAMAQDEVEAEDEVVETSSTTLPSGLQLHTTPPGAELFALGLDESLDEDDVSLGSTPFVLSSSLRQQPTLDLLVRLPGYADQRLAIQETAAGQDIRLILHPERSDDDGS